ncbi:hypothetical protein RH858_13980 [Halalkaliarchaeum sp. AArc-GB]|uniref:hypothetical protein n=1 Tax=Halalkaliarchaeum sp. AArc-GB TaxID=3074078 RepID=UPI0028672130|nr:hypothetical protein [Halalkaliarchaeum sp. AArc-GB]MDR5674234.1 hypothetical protein [Halalkaliarchaeum sp. AArc-GB]
MAVDFNFPSLSSVRILATDLGRATKEMFMRPYQGLWYTLTSRYPIGTNVFEREWDLLIVLDACRVDAMREVADEYEFIENVDSIWSVGSNSHEWLAQTFSKKWSDEISKTAYITANFHSKFLFRENCYPPERLNVPFYWTNWDVVEPDSVQDIVDVWEGYRDDDLEVTPPDIVTDHAIDRGRTRGGSKIIVHYMQPHGPYIANAVKEGTTPTEIERGAWRSLREGQVEKEELWEYYLENLRLVLDQVDILLENFDAERVAITSDHGEAFGEFGAYGHPEGFPHPVVKRVPWIETTAEDQETRTPKISSKSREDVEIRDRLDALGYLEYALV